MRKFPTSCSPNKSFQVCLVVQVAKRTQVPIGWPFRGFATKKLILRVITVRREVANHGSKNSTLVVVVVVVAS